MARRRRPELLAAALVAALGASAARAATESAKLASGDRAVLVDRKEIFLEALPRPAEGLLAFCRRLTGETERCNEISRLNGAPRRLLAGRRYRVPFALLTSDLQLSSVRALFPEDRATPDAWIHRGRGEDLGRVAEWFTGDAGRVAELRTANGRRTDRLKPREEVRIPDAMLRTVFRVPRTAAAPQPPTTLPTVPATGAGSPATVPAVSAPAGVGSLLGFGEDGIGPYAIYRLRGGEALYSAVVVRFTGRLSAEDVNELAAEIALRSGIVDVTDIPIGYPIKIPLDLLQPEFLPPEDPRRLEWEVERELAEKFRNQVEAKGLQGVTVILDSGHGGADVGAAAAGVWESNYVYDVMLRVKRRLETRTLARVETTTRDGDAYTIVDRDVLPYSRGHRVLTTPPYSIGDATTGVHLRWYLANSLLRKASAKGDPAKVVFLSIHADSLHASVRGATAYVANVAGTAGTFGKGGSVFEQRREYREQPRVSFPLAARQKSDGLSRDLAGDVIAEFRERGLEVHPFQPVRDRIYRGRRAWVPAVLRYNAVPAKLLLEVCNLANEADRKQLQSRAFREQVADAVVDGILSYFAEK